MSTLGTIEEVATTVGQLAQDASIFIPAPAGAVVALLGTGAVAVAAVLKALDAGVTPDSVVTAIEAAMKAASDAEMKAELKG